MQVSWVSDFERFSLKVKKNINNKTEKSTKDTSSYVLQKKEKALQERSSWLEKVRSEWNYEIKAKERLGQSDIAEEVKQQWSIFRKDKEVELTKAFKELLEENYPFFVECFIDWISKNYETGNFTLPKIYEKFIDKESYDIDISEMQQIIFSNDNLYIEYSVERIIEEFHDDIIDCLQSEENKWLR